MKQKTNKKCQKKNTHILIKRKHVIFYLLDSWENCKPTTSNNKCFMIADDFILFVLIY